MRILDHVAALRAQHPGMMLLFRVGDWYELVDGDAERAGELLGLAVFPQGGVAQAGFPARQLEVYLRKLLHAGCRVAVCDQVGEERPARRLSCSVCGADLGWDRPSGVCSQACLERGQGFERKAVAS